MWLNRNATNPDVENRYSIYKIKYIEDKIKSEPTERDYNNVIRTLRDFGITMDRKRIPNFKTFGDLERWQRKQIKLKLV